MNLISEGGTVVEKLLEFGLLGLSLLGLVGMFFMYHKVQNLRVDDALTRDDKNARQLDKISLMLEELLRR